MTFSIYEEKINWLFNQFSVFQKIGNVAFKPTLNNTLLLLKLLDVPINEMRFIHVAGTNGKGTTCSIVASAMTVSGKKTGLFTSPHIKDFRERIRINGKKISQEKVISYIELFQQTNFDFSPSFFEMSWAMALAYFFEENCDIVVVETGLGGRLDATNVISPELSVITNIGLDHIAILGDNRPQIAGEKAGIIKENTPVIIGESDEEINHVFVDIAKSKNALIYFAECQTEKTVFDKNKKLAFTVIDYILQCHPQLEEIKIKAIESLRENTGLYGRNQIYSKSPLIIIDAAHNLMGVKSFISDIQRMYGDKNVLALYGASNDKDIKEIVQLFPLHWSYYFTEFNSKRSTKIEEFKKIERLNLLNVKYFTNVKTAFREAQVLENKGGVIVVFGSFYLLEEII